MTAKSDGPIKRSYIIDSILSVTNDLFVILGSKMQHLTENYPIRLHPSLVSSQTHAFRLVGALLQVALLDLYLDSSNVLYNTIFEYDMHSVVHIKPQLASIAPFLDQNAMRCDNASEFYQSYGFSA